MTTLYNGFLKIKQAPNGHEYMERGDSVTALISIHGSTRFVTLKQFRVGEFIRHGVTESISNVAGMIDDGESSFDAILREIKEEIGVEPIRLQYLGKGFTSVGGTTEISHMYYAQVPNQAYAPMDKSEGITIDTTMRQADFDYRLINGTMPSAQMQLTYLLAKEKGILA